MKGAPDRAGHHVAGVGGIHAELARRPGRASGQTGQQGSAGPVKPLRLRSSPSLDCRDGGQGKPSQRALPAGQSDAGTHGKEPPALTRGRADGPDEARHIDHERGEFQTLPEQGRGEAKRKREQRRSQARVMALTQHGEHRQTQAHKRHALQAMDRPSKTARDLEDRRRDDRERSGPRLEPIIRPRAMFRRREQDRPQVPKVVVQGRDSRRQQSAKKQKRRQSDYGSADDPPRAE